MGLLAESTSAIISPRSSCLDRQKGRQAKGQRRTALPLSPVVKLINSTAGQSTDRSLSEASEFRYPAGRCCCWNLSPNRQLPSRKPLTTM